MVATTPWDSYLIRTKIWTYPPSAIIGPRLFDIPLEEVFFFVIQTYNTSLLYLLQNKPTFKSSYLVGATERNGQRLASLQPYRIAGQVFFTLPILVGAWLIWKGGEGTYMGLILAWAGPFGLLLWCLAYQFLLNLPLRSTVVSIVLPTLYLWVVDTLALRRGTWTIESGTKLGVHVWDGLDVEEAAFFLVTNLLITFGLVCFDNTIAIMETFPHLFPRMPELPSFPQLCRAILTSPLNFDDERIKGMQEAIARLKRKSRSFYLASSVFSGRLRIDLVLL